MTSAYKKKLEEDKKWLAEEKVREAQEQRNDVVKKGHMGDFYRSCSCSYPKSMMPEHGASTVYVVVSCVLCFASEDCGLYTHCSFSAAAPVSFHRLLQLSSLQCHQHCQHIWYCQACSTGIHVLMQIH